MSPTIYRQEKKYVLDAFDVVRLKSVFSAVLPRDDHAGEDGGYDVMSLYFDDERDSDMFTALSGIVPRKKYRLRMYDGDLGFIRLEKKVKESRGGYKLTAPIGLSEARRLVSGDFSPLRHSGNALLREVFLYDRNNRLRPVTITRYRRFAYAFPAGNVRVTLDTDLRCCPGMTDLFSDVPGVRALPNGVVILEIKYDAFMPSFITDMLAGTNAVETSSSKYAICRSIFSFNEWEVI
jgi:hypothetical protein